jgi:hypothetical protein
MKKMFRSSLCLLALITVDASTARAEEQAHDIVCTVTPMKSGSPDVPSQSIALDFRGSNTRSGAVTIDGIYYLFAFIKQPKESRILVSALMRANELKRSNPLDFGHTFSNDLTKPAGITVSGFSIGRKGRAKFENKVSCSIKEPTE